MVNTNMVYHSPKWWKEFKALRRKLQAASVKPQASSDKPQASRIPAGTAESQAPSVKLQADIKNPE